MLVAGARVKLGEKLDAGFRPRPVYDRENVFVNNGGSLPSIQAISQLDGSIPDFICTKNPMKTKEWY